MTSTALILAVVAIGLLVIFALGLGAMLALGIRRIHKDQQDAD